MGHTSQPVPHNDLQAIADSRLIEQYKNSPKLKALIALFIAELTLAQDAIWTLLEGFDLDTANDWSLDILGKHVGLPRPRVAAGILSFFGYAGASGAASYGDLTLPEVGGVYISIHGSTTGFALMENEDYRMHIKAKIIRNKSNANPEDILEIVRLVIPADGTTTIVIGATVGNIDLTIGRNLSTVEKALFLTDPLNANGDILIPRAVGVSIDYADAAGPF